MKTICINLGSNTGRNKIYVEQTIILAKTLVFNDYHVVYGGADVGLMGVLANTVLEHRGRITGVIPEHIAAAVGHKSLTELIVVKDMHERKQRMFELSDAFIALPGGYGTLDEVFELLTWPSSACTASPSPFSPSTTTSATSNCSSTTPNARDSSGPSTVTCSSLKKTPSNS
jgi:uncharacterized protein (TIGR00730 family)